MPITHIHQVTLQLNPSATPVEVKPGATIADFRGKHWYFRSVARAAEPGRSAKVIVWPVDPETGIITERIDHQFNAEVFPGLKVTSTQITKA